MIENVVLKTVNNMENKLIIAVPVNNEEMDKNSWLKEALNVNLKNALVGPIISVNSIQEANLRIQKLTNTFTHNGVKPQFLMSVPGQLFQILLPLDHLIIMIVFIPQKNGSLDIRVKINKLTVADYDTEDMAIEDN